MSDELDNIHTHVIVPDNKSPVEKPSGVNTMFFTRLQKTSPKPCHPHVIVMFMSMFHVSTLELYECI